MTGKPRDQRVSGAWVHGNVNQVSDVRGNVTIVNPAARRTPLVAIAAVLVVVAGIVTWRLLTPAEVVGNPAPLMVNTTVNPVRSADPSGGDNYFLFDRPVSELSPLPDGYETDRETGLRWVYENGGVDADSTIVEVVVQGTGRKSVVLTDVTITVAERGDPPDLNAVKLYQPSEGVSGREATVDLDSEPPLLDEKAVYSTDGDARTGESWEFPLSVSETRSEVLRLRAFTQTCDCSWTAELRFVADGKDGTIRIDDDGKPFRTASSANATAYYVQDGEIRPVPR